MITGGTDVAVLWWLFGPLLREWLPELVAALVVVTAVGVLGGLALVNLVSRFAAAALPGVDDVPVVAGDVEPEMDTRPDRRRPRTTGTTCVSASDQTVVLRLPDEVPR